MDLFIYNQSKWNFKKPFKKMTKLKCHKYAPRKTEVVWDKKHRNKVRQSFNTLLNKARHVPPPTTNSFNFCTWPLPTDLKRTVFMMASGKHTSRSRCGSLKWCSIRMAVGRSEEVFCASKLWWRIDLSQHLTSNLRRLPIQRVKRVSLTGTLCALNPSKRATRFGASLVNASLVVVHQVLI